ncbi:hypothetical protein DC522_14400 [Microvirga sp. KLBC 81]|uniref:hypothetical protein n=1 Tax=Microvirga sp. KLBC 81 TaxID=1862707 RepID=UPI000D51D01A|nr:hypothetical protein [Microvirga sp. KLBC 81]PVE23639.1 hypothetical protein DC522_14400 [Microvirga sp. KLBC 81]
MLYRLLRFGLERFEKRWSYDAGYLKDIAVASPPATLRFLLSNHPKPSRSVLPPEAYHAARLSAVLQEDCGPCAQLMIDMAIADGVKAESIVAIVEKRYVELSPVVAAVCEYVSSVCRGENAEELVEELRKHVPEKGLIALLFAASEARAYPFLKRGLGQAKACGLLRIQDDLVVRRHVSPDAAA